MRVRYKGTRKTKIDALFGSRAVFQGHGDIQPVADAIGARMVRFAPNTYEDAGIEKRNPPRPTGDEATDRLRQIRVDDNGKNVLIRNASRKAIAAYVSDELGIKVEDTHTKLDLLNVVANQSEFEDALIGAGASAEGEAQDASAEAAQVTAGAEETKHPPGASEDAAPAGQGKAPAALTEKAKANWQEEPNTEIPGPGEPAQAETAESSSAQEGAQPEPEAAPEATGAEGDEASAPEGGEELNKVEEYVAVKPTPEEVAAFAPDVTAQEPPDPEPEPEPEGEKVTVAAEDVRTVTAAELTGEGDDKPDPVDNLF